jgi:hypothetical protein
MEGRTPRRAAVRSSRSSSLYCSITTIAFMPSSRQCSTWGGRGEEGKEGGWVGSVHGAQRRKPRPLRPVAQGCPAGSARHPAPPHPRAAVAAVVRQAGPEAVAAPPTSSMYSASLKPLHTRWVPGRRPASWLITITSSALEPTSSPKLCGAPAGDAGMQKPGCRS